MKKALWSALAIAVLMIGAVSSSQATDITLQYSLDGITYTTFAGGSCVSCDNLQVTNQSVGGFLVSLSYGQTLNSTPVAAELDSNFSVKNGTTAGNLWLREIGSNFTDPASSPLNLQVQEAITSFTTAGTFSATTSGQFTSGGPCTSTTGTLSSGPSSSLGNQVTCANPGVPFGLQTTTALSLNANTNLGGSTALIASTVPEPTSMMLFGSGLMGFAGMIRRKLKK